jgi:hypothetical protein
MSNLFLFHCMIFEIFNKNATLFYQIFKTSVLLGFINITLCIIMSIRMPFKRIVQLSVAIMLFATPSAWADQPRLIGSFEKWEAFAFNEGGGKVCYMASKPDRAKGNYSSRGDIFALITHRPAEGTKNVFSYITGYSYKPASNATLKIGGQSFLLFTQEDTAWAPDADTDNRITDAVRKGSSMVVTGTSSRGTLTTDTFSLSGSGAAYDAITRECGL